FRLFFQNFVHSIQARKSLSDLGADAHHLKYGGDKESQIHGERKELCNSHEAIQNHAAADDHYRYADDTHQQRGSETDSGPSDECFPDIFIKPECTGFENCGLTIFSVKAFDHADAT